MSYIVDFSLPYLTGLTMKAAIIDRDGTTVVTDGISVPETKTGKYNAAITLADGQRGTIDAYTGANWSAGVFRGTREITAADENSDAKSSTLATPTNITAATGIVLAATGLDALSSAMPSGAPSTYREYQMASSRKWLNGGIYPVNGNGTITLNKDDNTPWLSQSIATDAVHQTVGRIQ